jgi:hypothetical protein
MKSKQNSASRWAFACDEMLQQSIIKYSSKNEIGTTTINTPQTSNPNTLP